jgi:dihydroneopterin aldolase
VRTDIFTLLWGADIAGLRGENAGANVFRGGWQGVVTILRIFAGMKVNESWIELRDIRLWGRHGVAPLEQKVGSEFCLNLRLKAAIADAAFRSDDLAGTVNYAEVYRVVHREFSEPSRLIENVAWRIAKAVLASFPIVETVEVAVSKLNPPVQADCHAATVRIVAVRDEQCPQMNYKNTDQ